VLHVTYETDDVIRRFSFLALFAEHSTFEPPNSYRMVVPIEAVFKAILGVAVVVAEVKAVTAMAGFAAQGLGVIGYMRLKS
jgi:hypothetical protein